MPDSPKVAQVDDSNSLYKVESAKSPHRDVKQASHPKIRKSGCISVIEKPSTRTVETNLMINLIIPDDSRLAQDDWQSTGLHKGDIYGRSPHRDVISLVVPTLSDCNSAEDGDYPV